jgi:hypothetical protein
MAYATLVSLILLLAGSSAWVFSGSNNGRLKHMELYMYEINEGLNATAIIPISSGLVANTTFGVVKLLDNELRDGPDPSSSSLIGRFQGIVVSLGLVTPPGKQSAISFMFTAVGRGARREHAGRDGPDVEHRRRL